MRSTTPRPTAAPTARPPARPSHREDAANPPWSTRRRPSGLTWIALLALVVLPASPAVAALRSPQVPVTGTALAAFLASQSQAIDPASDQLDLQQLSLGATASFDVHAYAAVLPTAPAGIYNALAPTPSLYQVWPGGPSTDWFPACSFRTSPTRLVVNLFDGLGTLQGTTTHLGADPTAFAFYAQGPNGTEYQQDARNPLGAARMLAFSGTGARAGSTWLAFETGVGPGGDFADLVLLVNLALAPVDVQRTTWGELRRRFR